MRKINKGEPISSFTEFVNSHHPTRWEDAKDVSRTWREYILEYEQYQLSGYTEEPLRAAKSHIDHFRKRSLFNTIAFIFDWNNLIVDSINETYGAKHKDNIVKTSKENEKLINPVTEDASRFFKYQINGKIDVADGLCNEDIGRAKYTISAFNLNESSLVERRRIIMNTIIDSYNDLNDETILDALKTEGFTSVVEQLLKERKQREETV